MWISSKVSRAKAPKNGRLPKKAAIIHKIPEFVGGTADFREGANKWGNSSRLTQSFHFFMFEPIF
ncbi:hypothetical protein, partial [Escherichia coli]|uniref:hypothetical protein n=1 Tax=Escherichia coli TaxID=562 RepID=UPI001BC8372D